MSDTGQPPPKRVFEPPPWEREQFEELARRRAEAERANAAIDELAALADPFSEPAAETEWEEGAEPEAEPTAQAETPARAGVDEKRIDAMLVQLSGEEVPGIQPIKAASRVLAGIVGVVGATIIVIAGLVGLGSGSSGPLAATGAGVGITIGGALIGVAVWLWVRAKR